MSLPVSSSSTSPAALSFARPKKSKSSSPAPRRTFAEITAEVFRRMQAHGIIAEYRALGVRFAAAEVDTTKETAECYSLFREEKGPSAYVILANGKYADSAGANAHAVDLWQVAVDAKKFTDWKEAREHYAQKVGETFIGGGKGSKKTGTATPSLAGKEDVSMPPTRATTAEDWNDCLAFEDWKPGRDIFLRQFCNLHRRGITPEAFKAAGGRYAIYTSAASRKPAEGETQPRAGHSLHVVCIPIYGPALLDAPPIGWVMWQKNGQPFPMGPDREPSKMKVCGSAAGVIGLHGLQALADDRRRLAAGEITTSAIARVWKVEGPTDLLALLSAIFLSLPQAERASVPVLSFAGGAKQCRPWMAALFSDHDVYLIHDADTTGEIGAIQKCCPMIGGFSRSITHVQLPFAVEQKHGKDLRDFLNSGKFYDDVLGLELFAMPFEVTDESRAAAAKYRASIASGGDGLAEEGENGDSDGDRTDDQDDENGSSHPENTTNQAETSDPTDPLNIRYRTGRTETAIARRFIRSTAGTLLYCPPWDEWLYWDGRRWKRDNAVRVEELAKAFALSLWDEIAPITGDEAYLVELALFVKRCNCQAAISNTIALARSEPGVVVQPEQFDAHPWLLNVENGTLNLANGELSPHNPTNFLTKLAPVEYLPDATAPTWAKFLADVTAPADGDPAAAIDPDAATADDTLTINEYLRRLTGYCLTGDVREHVMPFLFGSGANGKSTFLNTLLDLLGPDYAMKAAPELLMARGGESHPTERADLFGMRLVITNEIEEGRRLSESLVKDITGGDAIRARRMRENFWQFKPTHKIIMAGNHKPIVKGNDEGIWRRIKLVPFTRSFSKAEQNRELPALLLLERSGILNWALAGCREWLDEGLTDPQAIVDATAEYRGESDVLGNFIAERCETGQAWHRVRASALYANYRKWCEEIGEREMSQKRFGSLLLNDQRFQRKESHGIWYLGICLRDDDPREDDLPRTQSPPPSRSQSYTQQNFN